MRSSFCDKFMILRLGRISICIFVWINLMTFSWAESTPATVQPVNETAASVQASKEEPTKNLNESSDSSAEFFFYRCAGCHTVGGGKLTGPDLSTAAKWGAADLGVAIKKMEKNTGTLSATDIAQMINFLKDLSVTERITKQKEKVLAKLQASLPPPSFEKGKKLFRGQQVLQNGGPACISCHSFVHEGGSLGPDLSLIKDKASVVVLQSAIQNASYKIMRSIYDKRKITPEEALHLSEYLSHPEKVESGFTSSLRLAIWLAFGGAIGFFILLCVLNQHKKGPTRKKLLQKYLKG